MSTRQDPLHAVYKHARGIERELAQLGLDHPHGDVTAAIGFVGFKLDGLADSLARLGGILERSGKDPQ